VKPTLGIVGLGWVIFICNFILRPMAHYLFIYRIHHFQDRLQRRVSSIVAIKCPKLEILDIAQQFKFCAFLKKCFGLEKMYIFCEPWKSPNKLKVIVGH
jgi:hypothetical protein